MNVSNTPNPLKPHLIERLLRRWARPALLIYWPTLMVATHLPQSKMDGVIDLGQEGLDKLLHASCFAILAYLVIHACFQKRHWRDRLVFGLVMAGGYAVVDEFSQGLFGRSVEWTDLLADWAGVLGMGWAGWVRPPAWVRPHGTKASIAQPQKGVTPQQPSSDNDRPTFVGHAILVSVMTFSSRLLGLVRDAALAACFGMTSITDAFWIGFVVPNLFRRLFGEGALTAAFIPVYTDLLHKDPQAARRLAWVCVAALIGLLSVVTLISELLLVGVSRAGEWTADTALALYLVMIMLPFTPMICTVALLGGVLQVHHRFGPPAAAPIVLNLIMIGATLLAAVVWGNELASREAIRIVAWSVLLAGAVQLVWQGWLALRYMPVTLDYNGVGPPLRAVIKAMGPMAAGLAVFQINALLDSLIAWGLSPKTGGDQSLVAWGYSMGYPIETGAVTGLQFAQRLYQFPLGVFGIAIATTIFPALSHALSSSRHDSPSSTPHDGQQDFRKILRHGLRLTMFIGLPASVGLILVRLPLSRLIFERHQFSIEDSMRVATILAGYASAVWAYSMTHVLTRAFFAMKDARTPLRVSLVMVGCNLILNMMLVWRLGAAALAWSTAICAAVQALALLWLIGRRVDGLLHFTVWRAWGLTATLTLIMTIALGMMSCWFDPAVLSRTASAWLLFAMVGLGIAIIYTGAKALHMTELSWLLRRQIQ